MSKVHTWAPHEADEPIEYVHSMHVEPWLIASSDAIFVAAARVSTAKDTLKTIGKVHAGEGVYNRSEMPAKDHNLLNDLITEQHSGPFTHGLLSVYVDCPLFVWQQIGTHPELKRSRESARYRTLRRRVYVPSIDRAMLVPSQGFSAMRPVYYQATRERYERQRDALLESCWNAFEAYGRMLKDGVAKEVARSLLPMAAMSTGIVSAAPLYWLRALSVRTQTPASKRKSHVQAETAEVFMAVDAIMRQQWPETMAAFDAAGRVSP